MSILAILNSDKCAIRLRATYALAVRAGEACGALAWEWNEYSHAGVTVTLAVDSAGDVIDHRGCRVARIERTPAGVVAVSL